jgi:KaiC/GvpD/RAD55 family RecA-like ATPase
LDKLVRGGVDYGTNLLVEFEPHSLWYETSLTIASIAANSGIKTEYHTFQHIPSEIRRALKRLGLDVEKAVQQGTLTIIDSYTVQTGVGVPETPQSPVSRSVKVSDWSIEFGKRLKTRIPESLKRSLHIDDNCSVLLQYNQEKEVIDFWRTRIIPIGRAHEDIMFHAHSTGVASDSFYRQFELLCDGIIDFKSEEKGGEMEHYVRARTIRGRTYDSRWHRISLRDNGEVALVD